MPSKARRERRRSLIQVPVGDAPDDRIEPRPPYPWEGIGPPGDWHLTQREFLEFALRELGPERARVALSGLEGGEAPGEEAA